MVGLLSTYTSTRALAALHKRVSMWMQMHRQALGSPFGSWWISFQIMFLSLSLHVCKMGPMHIFGGGFQERI